MLDSLTKDNELLANIQARGSELAALLEEVSSHWVYEDLVYRFYYQSFKVYWLQDQTKRIVEALQSVAPSETTFSPMFEEIYAAGASGKQFEMEHNQNWTEHTPSIPRSIFPRQVLSGNGREVWGGTSSSAYRFAKRLGGIALFI